MVAKQTWTYASAPGRACSLLLGTSTSGLPPCPALQPAWLPKSDARVQATSHEAPTWQALTSPVCGSRSARKTCCLAGQVRRRPPLRACLPAAAFNGVQSRAVHLPAADGTLKLWDLRKFKVPLRQADDLPCNYVSTQAGMAARGRGPGAHVVGAPLSRVACACPPPRLPAVAVLLQPR